MESKEKSMRKIPVFVSCPTELNEEQEKKKAIIMGMLEQMQVEARTLGQSDYPKSFPLREILVLAKHCSGGIILGFEQIRIDSGIKKRGTLHESRIGNDAKGLSIPTPWNNLEAGIFFSLNLPLLIFKEENIEGGIFDNGVSDVFIHKMPEPESNADACKSLQQIFLIWYGEVNKKYYSV